MSVRPRVLFVTPFIPSLTGGGALMRAGQHLRCLAADYDVTLFCPFYQVPMNGDGLSLAMAQHCVRQIVFPGPKSLRRSARRPLLGVTLGSEALRPRERTDIEAVCKVAERHLKSTQFDCVFAFRLKMGRLVEELHRHGTIGSSGTFLDLDDLESVIAQRGFELHHKTLGVEASLVERLRMWRARRAENTLARKNRAIFVCSDHDREALKRCTGASNVYTIPNTITLDSRKPLAVDLVERGNLLLVGSMTYAPNSDGALWFCSEVLPILRRNGRQNVRVSIVGREPPARVVQLSGHADISVAGSVPFVAPYYERAHVSVAPIRYGSGTRIKILEAMSYGRPVVSTSVGAEGLDVEHEKHVLLADTAAGFAQAVCRLLDDQALWHRLVENGRDLVESRYSLAAARQILKSAMTDAGCLRREKGLSPGRS